MEKFCSMYKVIEMTFDKLFPMNPLKHVRIAKLRIYIIAASINNFFINDIIL